MGQLLGAAQPCAHTSECTVIETPCGLPGVCTGGVCTQGPGAGETCGEATDCPVPVFGTHVPHCLTDGGFAGGYCVQECAHGWGCDVPDARCRALPDNPYEPGYCFLDCSTDSDCRVGEGYRCCPSWDGSGEPGSVCYPGPCPSR
ncbi:hypothetical protein HZA57_06740 [Candidatus Poribacteria bacterium]|nr:hypothetical protein [Candidatus Poribacteria bacterium]